MSAPPSPHIRQVAPGNVQHRKKDRPLALEIPENDTKAVSDGEVCYGRANSNGDAQIHTVQQVRTLCFFSLLPMVAHI